MIILKSYKNLIMDKIIAKSNIDLKTFENEVWIYKDKLLEKGWIDIPIEGGLLSPDQSTLFIYSRHPYNGQFLQYKNELIGEYNKMCIEFLKIGDFIIVP